VLQLGLAQMSLSGARRLCQCATLTISSRQSLPLQIDGEPFEIEPLFAPRTDLSITIRHHNQAVMLSRSRARTDGVALEALDWAMQEGVISVDQRNSVLREMARRTGTLQRRVSSSANLAGMGSFANLGTLMG
jgi:diacylglycerol kinase (ATP)